MAPHRATQFRVIRGGCDAQTVAVLVQDFNKANRATLRGALVSLGIVAGAFFGVLALLILVYR